MNNGISNRRFPVSGVQTTHYLLLFLIWPFMSFLLALANYSQKEAKRVVYLFLIYYGFTFVNTNEYVDAFRYAISFKENALLPFSDFFKVVGGLYSDTTVDIAEPLVSFLVSRVTTYEGVYFAIWAVIFGFFYLKSINILHRRYIENPGLNGLIPMVFFIIILPITAISGVRMWTAAWIFFYGAYNVIIKRDLRYLLLAFLATFVHWSFIAANGILLIYFFLGNRNFIYFSLALVSFVLPRLIQPLIQSVAMGMGGTFQSRYEGYSSEGFILSQRDTISQSSWFLQIGNNLTFYFLICAIVVIQLSTRNMEKSREERNLYSFILLFLTFVNFGSPIPSFGGRFQLVFFLFASLYLFLYLVKLPRERLNWLSLLALPPMFLYLAIIFRTASVSISVWLFSPLFGAPLLAPVMSLADILFL